MPQSKTHSLRLATILALALGGCGAMSDIDPISHSHLAASVRVQMLGDTNGTRTVDTADGLRLLEYLYSNGPAPACMVAGDVNRDKRITIEDAMAIFNGGGGACLQIGDGGELCDAGVCGAIQPGDLLCQAPAGCTSCSFGACTVYFVETVNPQLHRSEDPFHLLVPVR